MPLRRALPALLLALVPAAPAWAEGGEADTRGAVLFDARDQDGREARTSAATDRERRQLGRELGRQGVLDIDPDTGTPRVVLSLDGALTGPSGDGPASVALGYIRENAVAFGLTDADLDGLRLRSRSTTEDGLTVLRWTQVNDGIPAFDSGLKVAVDRAGRILSVSGSPAHALDVASPEPEVTASAALAAVRRHVEDPAAATIVAGPEGARQTTEFADGSRAALVVFATAGADQLAWDIVTDTSTGMYHAAVDATSGRVLFRANMTKEAVNAEVFENYPGAPGGGTASVEDIEPWLGVSATTLTGPNARVFADLDDDNTADAGEEVNPATTYAFNEVGDCGLFTCSWDSSVDGSWEPNLEQNATQVFYFLNRFHDHLEQSAVNFGAADGQFEGADFVVAHSNDGATTGTGDMPDADHVDNANMSTPPNGTSPRMQMYLFSDDGDPTPVFRDVNGGDTASIVYHEYTHGLSNRLVTSAGGYGALDSAQAGAMGEAWSDWYAMDFLVRELYETDTPGTAGEIDLGTYTDAQPHAIRYQGLDCPVDPTPDLALIAACPAPAGGAGAGGFTYGDFGNVHVRPEVHSDGEIWAQTLWDLRMAFVAEMGNSDSAGSDVAEDLITDGMRIAPAEPSFLDMRNAILVGASNAQKEVIWEVFAARGMGFFASTLEALDPAPLEDFSLPPAAGATGTLSGKVKDAVTGIRVPGAEVSIGGLNTFDAYSATSAAGTGNYTLSNLPAGTYKQVLAGPAAGYDRSATANVTIANGATTPKDLLVRRNWASEVGGAEVTAFDGDDFTSFGCGPSAAIDQSQGIGWSAGEDPAPADPGPYSMTIELPAATNISTFALDPSATCGDDWTATLKNYAIETSVDGTLSSWIVAKNAITPGDPDQFDRDDIGKLAEITPDGGTANVRFVRLTLHQPLRETAGDSGEDFIDVSEFAVYGGSAAGNVLPSGTLQATPSTVVRGQSVALDASSFTDPDSAILSYGWDFENNGSIDLTTTTPTTSHTYGTVGGFTAKVSVNDYAGGSSIATKAITVVENVLATPEITGPAENAWNRTGTIALTGTGLAGATVKVFEDDTELGAGTVTPEGGWSVEIPDVAHGSHAYTAQVFQGVDASARSAARTVRVDRVNPDPPTIVTPASGAWSRSPGFAVTGIAEPGASVELREAGSVVATAATNDSGAWSASVSGLVDGSHDYAAVAIDPAGNRSAEGNTRQVRVDTTAPNTSITGAEPPFAFVATEEGSTFECRLSRGGTIGAWQDCASEQSFASIPQGAYVLKARAVDPAGNVDATPASVSFRVRTPAQAAVRRLARAAFPQGFVTPESLTTVRGLVAALGRGADRGRLALRATRSRQPVVVLGCERACRIRVRLRLASSTGNELSVLRSAFKVRRGRARVLEVALSPAVVRALQGKPRVRVSMVVVVVSGNGTKTRKLAFKG